MSLHRKADQPSRSGLEAERDQDDFQLDGNQTAATEPLFDLVPDEADTGSPAQAELYLPEPDDADSPQLELEGMAPPVFAIQLDDGRSASFQRSGSLLEALEAEKIFPQYQCREGYCGSCRAELLKGDVHYTEEPLAWLDDNEILLCCCVPTSPVQLRLPS